MDKAISSPQNMRERAEIKMRNSRVDVSDYRGDRLLEHGHYKEMKTVNAKVN